MTSTNRPAQNSIELCMYIYDVTTHLGGGEEEKVYKKKTKKKQKKKNTHTYGKRSFPFCFVGDAGFRTV